VAVGFTASIGLIIFTGQLHELFGLQIAYEPAAFIPKVHTRWEARDSVNPYAIGMAGACLALILGLRALAPRWPGLLLAAVATFLLHLPIETIGTRFGGIPRALPAPGLPHIPATEWLALMPAAMAIAVLGGIESLLSAVVADGMTGRRHRSIAS
jgi:sulfate permease, SulP family